MAARSRRVGSAEKVAFLADPHSYRDGTRRVSVIETHFAWVFLCDRHAWKLKRPMRQWPLDYRTLASRRRGCRAELELNRRLAPSVYLDVVPLVAAADGALALDAPGHVVDWLVKMRRLRAADMLDRAIALGTVREAELVRVARLLARFHAQRATPAPLSAAAYRRRLQGRVRTNRRALAARELGVDRRLVDAVAGAQLAFLARAAETVGARAARIVDGHGDLRAEHVCLRSPVCVIDCLEFDRNLRRLDPLEELAALAVDCRQLGAARIAAQLLAHYWRASGERPPAALVHYYMSQRATTRAKIAAWHLRDPRFADRPHWIGQAHACLAEAQRQADAALTALGSARRPVLEERGEGFAAAQAPQRLAEKRCDRQYDELAAS